MFVTLDNVVFTNRTVWFYILGGGLTSGHKQVHFARETIPE